MNTSEAGRLGGEASKKTNLGLKNQRIEKYNTNPKLCKYCFTSIDYYKRRNNFCSQSCSAKLLNLSRGFQLSNIIYTCLYCRNQFSIKGNSQHKYCSRKCMSNFGWQETKNKIIKDGYDDSYDHRIDKRYLIELNNGKCQICKFSHWLGQPIPLVLDHISGNSEDGLLSNLRVICNNCDALTPTYKSKNIGNGRAKRRQRYKDGKSY